MISRGSPIGDISHRVRWLGTSEQKAREEEDHPSINQGEHELDLCIIDRTGARLIRPGLVEIWLMLIADGRTEERVLLPWMKYVDSKNNAIHCCEATSPPRNVSVVEGDLGSSLLTLDAPHQVH